MSPLSRRSVMLIVAVLGAAVLTAAAMIASVAEAASAGQAVHHRGWSSALVVTGP
jgi:hypothetical protein